MTDFVVAIPSRQRPELVAQATIPWLTAGGVPPEAITVFVGEDDPACHEYRDTVPEGVRVEIVQAAGITEKRRIISEWWPYGKRVVVADDDVTALRRAVADGQLEDVADVAGWLAEAFELTWSRDLSVWGVCPVPNAFFLDVGRVTDGLRFLIGTLYGFRSRPGHPVHDIDIAVKEDYEFSLRAWWYDGGAIRFGDVAPLADHYKAPGGCVDTRTPAVSEAAAADLLRRWPGLVRENSRRTSGHTEILLSARKRHLGRDVRDKLPWEAMVE